MPPPPISQCLPGVAMVILPGDAPISQCLPGVAMVTLPGDAPSLINVYLVLPWLSYLVMPLLVAMMSTGAMSDSRARFKKEKHSMSNM